ncbi:MAG: DUF1624 domain-containing protein [Candidatus Thermoplasmatota archaeon]|nr:DUF1624 domain-containing protein [Candidatus Thermoplasmatota archaeon]
MPTDKNRYWEIDLIRGLAVILMIVFHIFFDLDYYNLFSIDFNYLPIKIFQYSVAIIFLALVGISLTLSYNKKESIISKEKKNKKFIFHGLKIFSIGLLITAVTWVYPNDGYIIFGVLHCIGISIIMAIPFLKYQKISLFIGIIFVFFGIFLRTITVNFDYLLWLGLRSDQFYTLDYFPLLPWFGVVLIGIFLGNLFYPEGKRRFNIRNYSKSNFIHIIELIGRKSLIIYLLHQPIIVGTILLLS